MATLRSDRWDIAFPPVGSERDLLPADFDLASLDSAGTPIAVVTLVTTAGGLLAVVPRAVRVRVNGEDRPVFAVLNHHDIVEVGQYTFDFDSMSDGSDHDCMVCGLSADGTTNRSCPLCGTSYCPSCEDDAGGRGCVGQGCQFRFPRATTRRDL
jgi:hypothetical protein